MRMVSGHVDEVLWPNTRVRRHPRHDIADGQGRRHVPELGRRTRARRTQATRFESCHLVLVLVRYQHLCQALQMDCHQEPQDL